MAADTGARPGRPSTSRAAACKTDCRREIGPVVQWDYFTSIHWHFLCKILNSIPQKHQWIGHVLIQTINWPTVYQWQSLTCTEVPTCSVPHCRPSSRLVYRCGLSLIFWLRESWSRPVLACSVTLLSSVEETATGIKPEYWVTIFSFDITTCPTNNTAVTVICASCFRCIDPHKTGFAMQVKVVTISSWLNFGHPVTSGSGSVAWWNFWLSYYSQRAVFASPPLTFFILFCFRRLLQVHWGIPIASKSKHLGTDADTELMYGRGLLPLCPEMSLYG